MSIYIYKNNQQSGPFEESKILEMLRSGELSVNDFAIRRGEKEWQKLSVYFSANGNAAPAEVVTHAAAPSGTKKSRKGLLFGFGGFFPVVLLIAGVLGFLAFRNLFPSPTADELPDAVKTTDSVEFILKSNIQGKGNIWGTEKLFHGVYFNKDYLNDYKQSMLYTLQVYADEKAAQEALEKKLKESCKKGEKPMRFSFVDGNMKELSTGAICVAPLYVQKGNKFYIIGSPGGANPANAIGFAENLPFNQGSRMMAKRDVPINPPQTFPDPNPEKKADFQVNPLEFFKETSMKETREAGNAKYEGKVVEISGLVYLLSEYPFNGKTLSLQTGYSPIDVKLGASQADKLQNIKEDERVRAKCDVSVNFKVELINCIVLERKPALMVDETPDITVTAKEFYDQVKDYDVSSEVRGTNEKKYIGKVIDLTGEVFKIGDDKNHLRVGESKWLTCNNDKDSLKQFRFLKDKQQVIFRAIYNGSDMRGCILLRWF